MEAQRPADQDSGIYAPLEDLPLVSEDAISSDQSRWAIRCVSLGPGQGGEPLRCELVNSHLATTRGKYEALSYTWGDSTEKASISLNGRSVQVTANLACALRHLRRPRDERLLWIDALCINQADGLEVNSYVQRMWSIYQNSRNVVVFLGESRHGSDQALQLLFELSCLSADASERHTQITKVLADEQRAPYWKGLLKLMRRPWWSRAWIIQEYAVAPRVIFVCGLARLGGDVFNQAMEHLIDYRYNAKIPHQWQHMVRHVALTPISHLLSTRHQYQSSSPQDKPAPIEILYRSRGAMASDPRDKVYSLFRLIAEDPRLQPDYSRSTHDLYKDVVRAMIDHSGTLEILCHHNVGNVGLPNMPTWCPDWTTMRGGRYLLQQKKYSAAGRTRAHAKFGGNTLTVKGRALDQIELISKPTKYADFKHSPAIYSKAKGLWELASKRDEFPSDTWPDVPAAFPETLTSSRSRQRGPDGWSTHVLDPSTVKGMWNAWCRSRKEPFALDGAEEKLAKKFEDAMLSALYGRVFFVSQQGRFGFADASAQVGDTIAVLLGGEVLFALREQDASLGPNFKSEITASSTKYNLVGEW